MTESTCRPTPRRRRSPTCCASCTTIAPGSPRPAVSPDGQRIAFVVATIDLDENTTTSRVWLDGPGRRSGAGHGRAQRRPAGLVARRAVPRLHVQAWREGQGGDAARHAGRRTRRGAHARVDARGLRPTDVVAGRQADRLHQPHPRQALRRQGRELAAAAQDRDVLHPAQRRGLDRRPADARLRRQRRWHRHAAQPHARAAPARRRLVAPRLQRDRHQRAAPRRLGPRLRRRPLRRPARRRGPRAHHARPATTPIRRCRPTAAASRCSGIDDPRLEPQNAAVGVIGIDGGEITWISTAVDRNWQPFASARQPVWTDDNTLLATVEDRGETHLYELTADGSRAPQALTKGPLAVQGFDAAGGTVAMAQATVQRPAELFTLDGQVTSRDAVVVGLGEVRRAVHRRHRRDRRLDHAAQRLRRVGDATRSCSTSTAARSRSTARRSSTRRRCRRPPASSS